MWQTYKLQMTGCDVTATGHVDVDDDDDDADENAPG